MIRDVAVSSQVFPSRESAQSQESNGVPIYHLVNNDTSRTWKDLLRWIRKLHSPGFAVLSPRDWISNLEELQESGLSHPAMKLIGLWNDAVSLRPLRASDFFWKGMVSGRPVTDFGIHTVHECAVRIND